MLSVTSRILLLLVCLANTYTVSRHCSIIIVDSPHRYSPKTLLSCYHWLALRHCSLVITDSPHRYSPKTLLSCYHRFAITDIAQRRSFAIITSPKPVQPGDARYHQRIMPKDVPLQPQPRQHQYSQSMFYCNHCFTKKMYCPKTFYRNHFLANSVAQNVTLLSYTVFYATKFNWVTLHLRGASTVPLKAL